MSEPIYRFGKFELCSGELHAAGVRVRMQEKPLLLLTVLLQNPNEVVTREQLRQRMWPSGTFVDYEQGINVAVKKVRDSLGDSADEPQYIETIAKKGYRFLLKIEIVEAGVREPGPAVGEAGVSVPSGTQTDVGRSGSVHSRWVLATFLSAVIIALVGTLVYVRSGQRAAPQIKSIAVLPLQNLSADPEQEYFADGITDELITNLAQLRNLRVISRTSTARYKQTKEPIAQIARELGADAIVEGSITRSGNRVRITAQLIDGANDRHLWASSYERDLGDVLMLQAEISREISNQVGATLAPQQQTAAAATHVVDPHVYELCLLGRFHWNKRTAADLAKAAEYYQQAIDGDPKYAPAYAGLANAYALMPHYNSVNMRDSFAKAEAAARRALELDDTLAEPHATLGFIGISDGTADWIQAGHELQRALELNPNLVMAHDWLAFHLFFSDQQDEALAEIELARQLDPLSAIINADEGHFLYAVKRYEEARTRLRQAIDLAPGLGQPHATLALVELEEGHSAEAIKEALGALALDPNNSLTMGEAGYVFAITGRKDQARRLLARLKDLAHKGSALPLFAAFIHLGLGQRNEAIVAIEEMRNPRFATRFAGFTQWHFLNQLNGDPRYQQLIAETKEQMFRPSRQEIR